MNELGIRTQIELAQRAGVGVSTVQRLLNGTRVRPGKEAAVLRALGWEPGDLDEIRAGRSPLTQKGEDRSPSVANPDAVIGMSKEAWDEHIASSIRMILDGTAKDIWGDERTREFKRGLIAAARLRGPEEAAWVDRILG